MIKKTNFSKKFSESSQMMLKLGRNEYAMGRNLVKLKNFDDIISNSKV